MKQRKVPCREETSPSLVPTTRSGRLRSLRALSTSSLENKTPLAKANKTPSKPTLPVYKKARKSSKRADDMEHMYDFELDENEVTGKKVKKSQKVKKRAKTYVRHTQTRVKKPLRERQVETVENHPLIGAQLPNVITKSGQTADKDIVPCKPWPLGTNQTSNIIKPTYSQPSEPQELEEGGPDEIDRPGATGSFKLNKEVIMGLSNTPCKGNVLTTGRNNTPEKENRQPIGLRNTPFKRNVLTIGQNNTPHKENIQTIGLRITPLKENKQTLGQHTPHKENRQAIGQNKTPYKENRLTIGQNKTPYKENRQTIGQSNTPYKGDRLTMGQCKTPYKLNRQTIGQYSTPFKDRSCDNIPVIGSPGSFELSWEQHCSTPAKDRSYDSTRVDFDVSNCFGFEEEPEREEVLLSPIRAEETILQRSVSPRPIRQESLRPQQVLGILKSDCRGPTPVLFSPADSQSDDSEAPEPPRPSSPVVTFEIDALPPKKVARRSYERPAYLRNLNKSLDLVESEDEKDHPAPPSPQAKAKAKPKPKPKKKRNAPSKKEQEELDKWARAFNSQCQQVEAFDLCIE